MGDISGVLYVTSYTTLPSSERVLYPEMTSLGTPLSSSSVKVMMSYKTSAFYLELQVTHRLTLSSLIFFCYVIRLLRISLLA